MWDLESGQCKLQIGLTDEQKTEKIKAEEAEMDMTDEQKTEKRKAEAEKRKAEGR